MCGGRALLPECEAPASPKATTYLPGFVTLQVSPATLASGKGNAIPTYHNGKKGKSPLTAFIRRDPVNSVNLQVDLQDPLPLRPSQRPHPVLALAVFP